MARKPLPTVTIMRNGSPVRINASDYDPEKHGITIAELAPAPVVISERIAPSQPAAAPAPRAEPPQPATQEPASEPASPAPLPAAAVVKRGKRWFVTDQLGQDVSAPGIDSKGYATEKAAWDAILGGVSNA